MHVHLMEIFYLTYNVLTLGIVAFIADRGCSSPPAFQYTSEDFRDDHLPNLNAEEGGSPRSEFSVISEWQYILAAANAAGRSTRDSSGNNSEFETTCEVLNVSDRDLNSALGNLCAHPHVVRKPCRTRSMELTRVAHIHDRSASGELKNLLLDDDKYTVLSDSTNLEPRQTHADIICGKPLNIPVVLYACYFLLLL